MFQAEGPIVQDGDGLDEAMELVDDDVGSVMRRDALAQS